MNPTRRSKIIRRLLFFSPVALLAIAAMVVFLSPRRPPQARYTVDRATTYVLGPLAADGYIDYVTAVNQKLSVGIQPEHNANVLLWRMFGPHPEGVTMSAGYFRSLGMKRPPEHGEYWISPKRFLEEHPDLNPSLTAPPDEMNDTDPLIEAARQPWPRKKFPWIVAWLQANARPLELAIQASRRPQYYSPLLPGGSERAFPSLLDSLLPNVQECLMVARALACRAMLELDEDRVEDAWHDLVACHRLGRLLAQGGTLVECIAAFAIDSLASRADLAILMHGRLDSKNILAKRDELRRLPSFPGLADKVDHVERFMFLDAATLIMRHGAAALEALGSGKPPAEPSFFGRIERAWLDWRLDRANWDLVLRTGNGWYDRLAAALRIPDRPSREAELAAIGRDLRDLKTSTLDRSQWGSLFSSTSNDQTMADILIGLMLPAASKVQMASDRATQEQRNLSLAFALAAYRADHGGYPKDLQALAPKYIAQLPIDLFSGGPLIYRPHRDGYLLYSVGINGKDEQGHGFEDNPPGDDLSVRMPLTYETRDSPPRTQREEKEKKWGKKQLRGLPLPRGQHDVRGQTRPPNPSPRTQSPKDAEGQSTHAFGP